MKIKISGGAERDIADGCDFYGDIDPNLATYFHDSISADIDSLLLYEGVHAKGKRTRAREMDSLNGALWR